METELFLIRHGETEWNIKKRFQGQLDSPLTKNGKLQATALGKELLAYKFDVFISSDLGRAYETASQINVFLGFKRIETDKRIRERNFGILHGTTRIEAEKKYPEIIEKLWNGEANYTVPEGESREEFYGRTVSFLNDMAYKHAGKRILVICHGGVLNMAIRYVLQIDLNTPRRFFLPNTGINIFQYKNKLWYIKSLGLINHLSSSIVYDDTV